MLVAKVAAAGETKTGKRTETVLFILQKDTYSIPYLMQFAKQSLISSTQWEAQKGV